MNIHDEYARGTEDWHEMIENTNFAKYGFRQMPLVHRELNVTPTVVTLDAAIVTTPAAVCGMCGRHMKLKTRDVCAKCWAEMHD